MKLLKALLPLLLLSGLIASASLSGCGQPQVVAEQLTLAPLPAPPMYPAITWQADGQRLYLSTTDAQDLYSYLVEISAWSKGVMLERELYLQKK